MPKISTDSLAAHRSDTRARILTAFGELLFAEGFHSLTLAQVARAANVGRTALYNYFSDKEELLVEYTLTETNRYLSELRRELLRLDNPVDQLAAYIRSQIRDLASRHVPPGPAMRTMMSKQAFAALKSHVEELEEVLRDILLAGMRRDYLPVGDAGDLAALVLSCLASPAALAPRSSGDDDPAVAERIELTVRFIQRGVGARLDDGGRPLPLGSPRG